MIKKLIVTTVFVITGLVSCRISDNEICGELDFKDVIQPAPMSARFIKEKFLSGEPALSSRTRIKNIIYFIPVGLGTTDFLHG